MPRGRWRCRRSRFAEHPLGVGESMRTSPLPMTGMRSTASTTARMPSRLTVPLKPCARVRPWMVMAATPTCSNSRAKIGGGQIVRVPAEPHLDRDRHLHRVHDLRDQIDGCPGRIAHHGRSAAAPDDLVDRAAHVDVDDRRAVILNPLGAGSHVVRVAAVDLHRQRPVRRDRSRAIPSSASSPARMARTFTRSVVHSPTPPTSRTLWRNGRFV